MDIQHVCYLVSVVFKHVSSAYIQLQIGTTSFGPGTGGFKYSFHSRRWQGASAWRRHIIHCHPTPMAHLFKTCLLSVWHVRSEKNSEIFLQILFFVLVGIKGHLENGELLKNVALRLHLLDRLVLYSVQLGNASLPNLTCCGNYLTRRVVICQICPGSDDRMTYPRG